MSKKEENAKNFLQKKFLNESEENSSEILSLSSKGSNEYMIIPLNNLPCGIFYKAGTKISIRGADVKEVQEYSVVDDKNYLDVTDKMNNILKTCIRFTHPDGRIGSYKNIKDADRLYIIFMIRELTFPGGKNLSKEVTCHSCKNEFKIEFRATSSDLKPRTFYNYEMPEKLTKFFDEYDKVYKITINDVDYEFAPPTIGLQESLFSDIKQKVQMDKNPNVSFLKIMPFIMHEKIDMKDDEITKKLQEFGRIDMESFQVINQFVNNMIFGIKELKTECPSCRQEVYTDMTFPSGASSLFVISDALEQYIG